MTITNTDEGLAVVSQFNSTHDGKPYLGRIVWTSQTETIAAVSDVQVVLDRVGLGGYSPRVPSLPDVFRRVTKAVEQTIDRDDGSKWKIMARNVKTNPDEVIRRMVVEQLDASNKRLSYGQTWDLRFNKEFSTLNLYPINVEADGTIRPRDRHTDPHETDELIAGIRSEYHRNVGHVDANGLRTVVNNVLKENLAVSVRPTGSVYFVPRSRCGAIEGLQVASADIAGMSVHSIPLPDEPGQPEMLTGAVSSSTVAAADALIAEMKAAKTGQEIGKRRLVTMVAEHRDLKRRLNEFKGLLADDMTDATTRLEILDGLLVKVIDLPTTDT